MKSPDLIVALGSNVEEAFVYFEQVRRAFKSKFQLVQSSCLRYTPAVNFVRECLFLNQLLVVNKVDWDKGELTLFLKGLERETPRSLEREQQGWIDLDVDLLCWKGKLLKKEDFYREDIQNALRELDIFLEIVFPCCFPDSDLVIYK